MVQVKLQLHAEDWNSIIIPHPEHNSKWTSDLNIRADNLTLLEDEAGNMIQLINMGKNFLERTL